MRRIMYWQCDTEAGCGKQFDKPATDNMDFAECSECGSQVIRPIYGDVGTAPRKKRTRRGKAGQSEMFKEA